MEKTYEYLLNKYGTTLSFQEAQDEIGVYWQTIREMCLRGDIKTARAGRRWILTTKALANFLDRREQQEIKDNEPIQFTGRGNRKVV